MFVLCWTSGHKPPRVMYYREYNNGWGTTEDRGEAKLFRTEKQALDHYLSLVSSPEFYARYIRIGAIRAEEVTQPEMNWEATLKES